ncbi:MAG: alkaline phosphatase PhoX [Microcystaceae cyanobacterium]
MKLSRRTFLLLMGTSAVTTAFASPFKNLYGNMAKGRSIYTDKFGQLIPDTQGIIDLPQGFSYQVVSRIGRKMSDGYPVPTAFDGMASFQGANNHTILVRNHELSPPEQLAVQGDLSKKYDPQSKGGTTTVILDQDNNLIEEFVSLNGTNRNCAGGTTPWQTWISCEEDTTTPTDYISSDPRSVKRKHGYNFEVSPFGKQVEPTPLIAMGRFRHEAIAVDPTTNYIYQTEDQTDSCFYRFLPKVAGKLSEGGKLEALVIEGNPKIDTGTNFPLNKPFKTTWVPIENVDPDQDIIRYEAQSKGAAIFRRGEGLAWAEDGVYWTCTNGGNAGMGQVFHYNPQTEMLRLFAESPSQDVLDYPDNLILSPFGDFILCEDGRGQQFLIGLTTDGKLYRLAKNALNNSEFAGVCFAPDGKTMFVNIYQPGLTLAIQGFA